MSVIKRLEERYGEKVQSEVIYNNEHARVLRFYLRAEQEVKPHKSPSSVFITVLKGKLLFLVNDGKSEEMLNVGDTVFYNPQELHGFKAIEDSIVEAVITPNPSINKLNIS